MHIFRPSPLPFPSPEQLQTRTRFVLLPPTRVSSVHQAPAQTVEAVPFSPHGILQLFKISPTLARSSATEPTLVSLPTALVPSLVVVNV